MLLSDHDIVSELDAGRLAIDPFNPTMLQPASVDIRLGPNFRVFNHHTRAEIDPTTPMDALTTLVEADPTGFVLHPGQLVLASTVERVRLGRQLAARLEGKSSLGRLGLVVHSTAGFVDPGFEGTVTLELSNAASLPIRLYPHMKVGQLCFLRVSTPVIRPYGTPELGSRYQGQHGPTASQAWRDFPPGRPLPST